MLNTLPTYGLALALAGMVVGCGTPRYADVPAPTRFDNSKQQKLQAAQHWQIIADHFASQLATDLRGKLGQRALYVPQPRDEQPFVDGFRELLITALVAQGVPVGIEPRNALTVDVRYSIYRFSANRAANTYYYGEASALAAGLWAVGGIVAANISPAGVAVGAKSLGVAATLEGFSWLLNEQTGVGEYTRGPVPRSEILLTASVVDASRIVSRLSNIYYTSDQDPGLYWYRAYPGYTLKVTGGDDCEGKQPCAR